MRNNRGRHASDRSKSCLSTFLQALTKWHGTNQHKRGNTLNTYERRNDCMSRQIEMN